MTKEEYEKFIKERHAKGYSNEDIVKIYCKMFQEKKISREQFEALLDSLGYNLSDRLKKLSDDDLRKSLFK